MSGYQRHVSWVICLSFLIAIVLQIMPCPRQFDPFRPSWINLMLIYWVMALPHRVNIGTGFSLGLIMDLILGSTLGVHALSFSILVYLVVFKFPFLRNKVLWQQSLIVMLLSLTTQIIIFWTEFLVIDITFRPEIFFSSVMDSILWPWLSLLMQKIYRQFSVQ
ncbi:rod shape-determining protein MreD [Candidatus Steffania adelgidicola]|uniref:rod shape-determining protein MreD n=1 Tax=Candidatus Steffania adelgidicola TaxID=1076626 RepID=UPI001D006980|nr:rod shape-determining protein MreD [Candidatus Steffania adelgidicola]UDG80041.1 Rod shape-determining protein MreD [Candidatus Steffania adelgidicola]